MKYAQPMLFALGVMVGGILWGCVRALVENNGLIYIAGLAFSCVVLGAFMSMGEGHDK